jgi:hypothetical protein
MVSTTYDHDGQAKALAKYFGTVRDFDVEVNILEMSGDGEHRDASPARPPPAAGDTLAFDFPG